ncbi:uncharacterized protein B0H18DRAFT_1205591 [Fomitopsis serialis]|uniref:uncharacterized protein n=1 Tax=Fomitopsis serialis TaxID=139415 RepID=UPI002008DB16|nr:uncharacterized protein B0H18DRAFT_1205591 [Neoantrodia serialis]KAH9938330.1 hypothetical protein B0H18DRAFT_1205591 [Neoantrodia serialis]
MSATTTPNDSPVHVQPLHNPSQAAHVVVPQAPLGNATNGVSSQAPAPGMGAKALLARKMSNHNPKYISPTDKMMTPVSQKLNAAKQKHFTKGAKPMQSLFPQKEVASDPESGSDEEASSSPVEKTAADENPFSAVDDAPPPPHRIVIPAWLVRLSARYLMHHPLATRLFV